MSNGIFVPTDETLALVREALLKPSRGTDMAKAFTQATGLVNYDLQKPAKQLYPVITPLRNKTPRAAGNGGTATNWRAITGLNTARVSAGVSEGNRNAVITTAAKNYTAAYRTLGLDDYTSFEAEYASEQFDSNRALMILGLLRGLMIEEENCLFGGNTSLALGTPTAPTTADIATGGAIPQTTHVFVSVVALTHEGYRTGSVTGGILTQVARLNADVTTDTVTGYSSRISAATDQITATDGVSTHRITGYTPVVVGAVAYAWFWGATAGAAQKLGAITTNNSISITTAAGTGTQTAADATLGTDNSRSSLLYDGYLYLAMGAGPEVGAGNSGALLYTAATGAAGVGTPFTADGGGGIVEIDAALKDRWDNYRLGIDEIYMNSQQLIDLTKKVLGAGGTPIVRFNLDAAALAQDVKNNVIGGGVVIGTYLNKFALGGGKLIKLIVHPNCPPGTMLGLTWDLPYPLSNVARPMELKMRRDYYQIEYPLRTRKYEAGVYCDSVLAHYFPPSMIVWTNYVAG